MLSVHVSSQPSVESDSKLKCARDYENVAQLEAHQNECMSEQPFSLLESSSQLTIDKSKY